MYTKNMVKSHSFINTFELRLALLFRFLMSNL